MEGVAVAGGRPAPLVQGHAFAPGAQRGLDFVDPTHQGRGGGAISRDPHRVPVLHHQSAHDEGGLAPRSAQEGVCESGIRAACGHSASHPDALALREDSYSAAIQCQL